MVIDDATEKEKKLNQSFLVERKVSMFNSLALVAHIFAQTDCFHPGIAVVAQCTILIPDESTIGQFLGAQFAAEALRMPIGCHRLDDTSDDEFAAFIAARRKQDVKVAFAIFSSLEFVEDAILEGTEALGATG